MTLYQLSELTEGFLRHSISLPLQSNKRWQQIPSSSSSMMTPPAPNQ